MSCYPKDPLTGRREPPVGDGLMLRLFETVALLVTAVAGITMVAALLLHGCAEPWAFVLA